jgi:hypothetical protein
MFVQPSVGFAGGVGVVGGELGGEVFADEGVGVEEGGYWVSGIGYRVSGVRLGVGGEEAVVDEGVGVEVPVLRG